MNNMGDLGLLYLITIISFIVGVENLDLNIKQSQDLEKHLSKQDEDLLKFIIKQNDTIIEALEELRV